MRERHHGLDRPTPQTSLRETRTRKLRTKKKMLVTLKHQHKTTSPSTNTRKVVSTTGKTTANTLGSRMQKTLRKKLHRGTKANHRRILRRGLMTTMMIMMEMVPRTTTTMATTTAEVTVIPAPEEAPRNVWGS